MGQLRIMGHTGDTAVTWDTSAPETVAEAERIVQEAQRKGANLYAGPAGGPKEKIDRFDPRAERILVVPPLAGG